MLSVREKISSQLLVQSEGPPSVARARAAHLQHEQCPQKLVACGQAGCALQVAFGLLIAHTCASQAWMLQWNKKCDTMRNNLNPLCMAYLTARLASSTQGV